MRHVVILISLISSFAVASPTANEDFVIAEAAKAYTNAVEAAKKLGGGGGAVSSVNGKTGAVVLTGSDIKTSDDPDAYTISDKIDSDFETMMEHIDSENNPHHVNAADVGAYTTSEVDGKLSLKQDELTDDQKAVLDGGPYLSTTGGVLSNEENDLAASLTVKGSSSSGGAIFVKEGGSGYGIVEVEGHICAKGSDPSIKKGEQEVATVDQLPSLAGQTFDFTDNRVLYTALSNIIIRLGGAVTNFPAFN